MTTAASMPLEMHVTELPPQTAWRRALRSGRVAVGGTVLLAMVLLCTLTLPWTAMAGADGTLSSMHYDRQNANLSLAEPAWEMARLFGTDRLGRSVLGRCLLGGAISLFIGLAAAAISVVLGVTVGLVAGYRGGWVDALLMRSVDVLFALPYVLMVILIKVAFEGKLSLALGSQHAANLVVLFVAIGSVSWLTMARVIRGQVLSLREMPFVEAARSAGVGPLRILARHLLPNLVGPIIVYTTLTIPQAILQESFLSFLGIGVAPPIPTWGSLAAEGVAAINTVVSFWWMLLYPCLLLGTTLLALNFVGDGLRDAFDPRATHHRT